MMSSNVLNQLQDVKSQMDQFRLFLQIQQERADDNQARNASAKNQTGTYTTPIKHARIANKARTSPRKPFQKKNFYSPVVETTTTSTSPHSDKQTSTDLPTASESSDEELSSMIKEHRKNSGSPSLFKKYRFSTDTQKDSTKKTNKKAINSDSTEVSKEAISISDSSDSTDSIDSSDSIPSSSNGQSSEDKYRNKIRIIRTMKLVDKIMAEPEKKKKKVSKLRISKPFAVPYSGSYEEGEVFKIETEDPLSDLSVSSNDDDDNEFDNFVPPVADEIESNQPKNEISNEDETIVQVKDIPDIEIPKIDMNFLNDDENKSNDNSESENESINDLIKQGKEIFNEEESD